MNPPRRRREDPFRGHPRPFLKKHDFHAGLHSTKHLLRDLRLQTVCEQARCPNMAECFARPTATFMILGTRCTRRCVFCRVDFDRSPAPPEADEPERIAQAAGRLGLRHVVITSVARDDLPDEGAGHFAACVAALRQRMPGSTVEVLTPDFGRDPLRAVWTIAAQPPDVFNHNLETVRRLQKYVRPHAGYDSSLAVLRHAAAQLPRCATKSGLMLGLGEEESEVIEAMEDLRAAGVTHLTLGQYFQPSQRQIAVQRYWEPEAFDRLRRRGMEMGFAQTAAGPYVRSSYFADRGLEPSTAPA